MRPQASSLHGCCAQDLEWRVRAGGATGKSQRSLSLAARDRDAQLLLLPRASPGGAAPRRASTARGRRRRGCSSPCCRRAGWRGSAVVASQRCVARSTAPAPSTPPRHALAHAGDRGDIRRSRRRSYEDRDAHDERGARGGCHHGQRAPPCLSSPPRRRPPPPQLTLNRVLAVHRQSQALTQKRRANSVQSQLTLYRVLAGYTDRALSNSAQSRSPRSNRLQMRTLCVSRRRE
eukprot:COSAG01_NODE_17877_length_1117_cov_1.769155_1_plen_233_part_00